MKLRLLSLLLLAPFVASAQSLREQGGSIAQLVPAGWSHDEAQGDLNGDGLTDLVVLATPDFKENMKTREDGYVYNFNQPILAIYFGSPSDTYKLWRQYKETIPGQDNEYTFYDYVIKITPRGTLTIGLSVFSSAGSYDTGSTTYTFRYQNGDFFLIGMDEEEFSRNSGERTERSYNYLTGRKQVVVSNEFDERVKPKETWTRFAKQPLERLGSSELQP